MPVSDIINVYQSPKCGSSTSLADMGQACSCFGSSETAHDEETQKKDKHRTSPRNNAPVSADFKENVSEPVAVGGQGVGPSPDAVTAIRTLVQQAQGSSPARNSLQDKSCLEDENAARAHPLDAVKLEEVLAKWDEDQKATLQRLEKAMQVGGPCPLKA